MSYINFNNAGSSYLTEKTQKIVKDFFDYENIVGGYNAENLFKNISRCSGAKLLENSMQSLILDIIYIRPFFFIDL